jgi:dihydropteroate synthase
MKMLIPQKDTGFFKKKLFINLAGELIDLSNPVVMGILNVTPDSFYDGGKYLTGKSILKRSAQILEEGGRLIDIGAYSTRPGAKDISVEEEINRLTPAFKIVRKNFPDALLSLDTFRSEVADFIVNKFGPCIINDISGGTMDNKMFKTVARLSVPYVLMHIQGTPETMQKNPLYSDVVNEIILFMSERVQQLKLIGVNDVIIDPGFGFGKLPVHNYELMNRLESFRIFQLPLISGVSRKAMIWRLLKVAPEESLNGTTVLNTLALLGGTDILRVHDVKEAVQVCKIVSNLMQKA